jgi:putative tricarboxylic transport membrane protein
MANNYWDIVIMLGFAVLGYLMKKFDYEPAPLVLAFVLGRMAEESIRQSLVLSRGNFMVFFKNPISCVAILIAFALILYPLGKLLIKKLHLPNQT